MSKYDNLHFDVEIDGRLVRIPDEMVDYRDFIGNALRIAPDAIRVTDDDRVILNFQAGDLEKIAKNLRAFDEIARLVQRAGIKKNPATAIGSMFVRWGLTLEVAEYFSSMRIQADPGAARESLAQSESGLGIDWDKLANE